MATEKKVVKTKYYVALREIAANEKCPPQAKLIVDLIAAAGGKILRDDLVKLLSRPPAEGGLTTRQTPERILGFYRPKLRDMGVANEVIEESTIEVEVPDKPAKPEKAAPVPTDGTAPETKPKGSKGTRKEVAA